MAFVQYLCGFYSNHCVFSPFLCAAKRATFALENLNMSE